MMKNKILLLGIIMALVAVPVFSLAETGTSSVNTEKKSTIKSEIDAKKQALMNTLEEKRQAVVDQMKEKADKFIQKAAERFEAAVSRLDNLASRIESRIAKAEAAKINVTETKKLMVTAKSKIEIARASVSLILLPSKVSTTTVATTTQATTTPVSALKKAFEATRVQMAQAKKDLKAAHAALVDVINSLKPGYNKIKDKESKATSTATTTNSD